MQVLLAIRSLLGSSDWMMALGLLTAVVVLFPPGHGGWRLALLMAAAVALTAVALYTIRAASRPGTRLAHCGSWARATAALGASASVLMIVDATVAAIA
jgi:hypothetical protein